ncbi:ABC transporter ATP-binding protein [Aquibaculum arenosum]|uniref:Glutathione import ATP-binding protein GsiA n=1 Tax=Aquibaculum arenosum TaxID=3032591 RepID=A0ABT5YQB8_9PROT|nr:ABC transporter ATP-binding protein [Fodinicurvata sp. CAU 1616]MDF2097159.1 ABC transporter ATP-binding protein [Fodinicurvata sp. CAU 1616]
MIVVDDLAVHFGEGRDSVRAVDGVSFQVHEGESYGLVGESGSGKSTVLRVLCGLQQQWQGRVTLAGAPLPKRPRRDFFLRVQMVFQDPYGSLHPRFTIDATLSEPLAIHGIGERRERVHRALEAVGLDPAFRFRFPHQLSGGQRQRVAIARALILEPRVLLLDEPTSALDVSVQAEILNLLARLRREHGLTYLLVSHDLAVVAHLCSRIAVMQGGQLVEQLSVEDLRRGSAATDYTRDLIAASSGEIIAQPAQST